MSIDLLPLENKFGNASIFIWSVQSTLHYVIFVIFLIVAIGGIKSRHDNLSGHIINQYEATQSSIEKNKNMSTKEIIEYTAIIKRKSESYFANILNDNYYDEEVIIYKFNCKKYDLIGCDEINLKHIERRVEIDKKIAVKINQFFAILFITVFLTSLISKYKHNQRRCCKTESTLP